MGTTFIQGTLILLVSSFITRILGFVYRIYIVRLIGAEGIGLYEMIFPVITLILVITTAGIPVALAKLVAEDIALGRPQRAKKTFYLAFVLLTVSGTLITCLLIYLGPLLVERVFADPRVYWAFMIMIPVIFFVSISSAFRGYFQGCNQMLPPAIAQLIEQLVRIIIGIKAVIWLFPYGIEFAAGGLALATVCGELTGLLTLLTFYHWNQNKFPAGLNYRFLRMKHIGKQLFLLATPVTLTRIISSLVLSIEAVMIPNRLQLSGAGLRHATEIYGAFSGMAMSLISFPTIITISLAISLVPAVSDAMARGNQTLINNRINQAFKFTIISSLPFAVLFFYLPSLFTQILFHNLTAAVPLKYLALGCTFMYLQQVTTGILHGLGRMSIIFRNSLIGNIFILTGIYYLTGLPGLGIRGTAIAISLGSTFICFLNLVDIKKAAAVSLDLKTLLIAPLISIILMLITLKLIQVNPGITHLNSWQGLLIPSLCSVAIYFLALFLTGGLNWSDFKKF